MRARYLWPSVAALATAACSSNGADESIAACYSGSDMAAMCVEQMLAEPDDRAYVMSTCASVNGRMQDRCPSEKLVGVCSRTADVPTGSGFAPRETRTFHYRHADVADERAVAAIGKRCGVEAWMSAEQWLATK